jgi:hypothetical protein
MNPATPPFREKLNAEQSAAARTQLIQEIQTLPEEHLQSRAIAILKTKNSLSAGDAKLVEEVFAVRMALQGDASKATPVQETMLTPTDSIQPQTQPVSTVPAMRPRGRPRKVKATSGAPDPSSNEPESGINNNVAPPLAQPQTNTTPGKIDKSQLTFGEPRRLRDKAHLKFVASNPCLICGRTPVDAHHLRFAQPRAMSLKVSDEFTVPLCRTHHRDNHSFGDEIAWWERRAIDPIAIARVLWTSTRCIE